MVTLTCRICGESFEWAKRGRQPSTCGSEECLRKRHTQSAIEYRWRSRGGSTVQSRICIQCGETFEFTRTQGMRGQGPGFCSDECRQTRLLEQGREKTKTHRASLSATERSRRRRVALLARYSLTPESYDRMLADQGGVCAICRLPESKHHSDVLKIDHDRSCCAGHGSCGKCVRGLLCSNCNRALGLFGDQPTLLRVAAGYLEQHQQRI